MMKQVCPLGIYKAIFHSVWHAALFPLNLAVFMVRKKFNGQVGIDLGEGLYGSQKTLRILRRIIEMMDQQDPDQHRHSGLRDDSQIIFNDPQVGTGNGAELFRVVMFIVANIKIQVGK